MKRIHTNRLKSLRVYLFLFLVGCVGMYAVYYFQFAGISKTTTQKVEKESEVVLCDSVFCEKNVGRVAAVVVDNAPESWPQAGVTQSSLVFEVPVEGGRTRLLAYFHEKQLKDIERVGPVRSLRDAFLDIGANCSILPVHVGGSPSSLTRVPNKSVDSLDEFFYGSLFLRSTKRLAPHNTYMYGEKLVTALLDRRMTEQECQPFAVRTGGGIEREDEPSFEFGELAVSWNYSTSTTQYVREIGKKEQTDEKGNVYTFNNVLQMYMSMKTIDEKLRRDISSVGSGRFELFSRGNVVMGTWTRKKITDSFTLRADNGDVVSPSGSTWVTILPDSMAPKSLQ